MRCISECLVFENMIFWKMWNPKTKLGVIGVFCGIGWCFECFYEIQWTFLYIWTYFKKYVFAIFQTYRTIWNFVVNNIMWKQKGYINILGGIVDLWIRTCFRIRTWCQIRPCCRTWRCAVRRLCRRYEHLGSKARAARHVVEDTNMLSRTNMLVNMMV